MIQQGTKFYMPIKVTGISLDDVAKIEFLFKQSNFLNAEPLKSALWDSENETSEAFRTEDSSGNDVIAIPWSMEETYLFRSGSQFYLHARIHPKDTDCNPPVRIVPIVMDRTLFAKGEIVE